MFTTTTDNQAIQDNQTNQTNTGDQSMNVTTHKDLEFDTMQGSVDTDKPIIIEIIEKNKKATATNKRKSLKSLGSAKPVVTPIPTEHGDPDPVAKPKTVLELAKERLASVNQDGELAGIENEIAYKQSLMTELSKIGKMSVTALFDYSRKTTKIVTTVKVSKGKGADQDGVSYSLGDWIVNLVGKVNETRIGDLYESGDAMLSSGNGVYEWIGYIQDGRLTLVSDNKELLEGSLQKYMMTNFDRESKKSDIAAKTREKNQQTKNDRIAKMLS